MVSNQGRLGRLPRTTMAFSLILFFSVMSTLATADEVAQPPLPTVDMLVNDIPITVEIASTAQQRYMGLSFRKSLAPNSGMLFVYPDERPLTFTMRNTLIPLSIAYLSKELVINEIHDMNVGPDQLFPSRKSAQYALEVDQGWFAANGINVGDQLVPRE